MAGTGQAWLVIVPVGQLVTNAASPEAAIATAKANITAPVAGNVTVVALGMGDASDVNVAQTTTPVTMAVSHAGEGIVSTASLQAFMNRLIVSA